MLQKILNILFGSQHERNLKALMPILHRINEKESWATEVPPDDFPAETQKLRDRYKNGESVDDLLPEAFALVREAARRVLGERHYDVQLLGGIALHQGKIMEMKTGEGKTLSSVTAAYLNAITGKGVHVVTVNDYLAERDANWMGPVYEYLGISVGVILSEMDNDARKAAYLKDVTYGTNNEFGFDYLRDNMRWDANEKVQKHHNFCVIDEIDSILIDEARTPLIISGPAEDDTAKFFDVDRLISNLTECAKDPDTGEYPEDPDGDFKIDEKGKRVTFTDEGMNKIEGLLERQGLIKTSLFDEENFEYIHYFTQALRAHHLFHKDVDYVVQEGQVQIVDEFTGRILFGRRYSDGLHQAIEAKERIKIAQRNKTLATITFQNYFRMYNKISGMTGTADTEAREFTKIYGLEVVVIPTNLPVARQDEDDVIYLDEDFKFKAICDEIERVHKKGQPILVGTVSIEKSERLASLLQKRGIRHEILNAKNHHREALIIAEAGAEGAVTIATNMAGRGTDIKLGGNPEFRARKKAGSDATDEQYRATYEKELELWRPQYERVKAAGGLYVLGTERHESRRIDNQLRGRSGRQGDPGVSRFFISLDDDLMRLFNNESLKPLMSRIGMKDGEPIFHPWINRAIERAQTRVEERNFEIRKHLLDYDDVLNEQRNFIYDQRDAILQDKKLRTRVVSAAEEIVADAVETFAKSTDQPESAMNILIDELKESFFYAPERPMEELLRTESARLNSLIMADLEKDLQDKVDTVGEENLNLFVRYEYLRSIDTKWQDHLDNLEALREAVYLRAYGQKNPLLEYKLEGFQIFDKLIFDIKTSIAKKLFKIRIQTQQAPAASYASPVRMQTNHREMGQFAVAELGGGGVATATREAAQATPENAQVRRTYPKVGRNEPCPCGSGRKYKYCHGK
ncbi:MAG TPA: preprotein translocase subunit SecA [Spirochaetia bacterium]|nr:preprotein translocase subunit SecA [Spirochaetia bacterium]